MLPNSEKMANIANTYGQSQESSFSYCGNIERPRIVKDSIHEYIKLNQSYWSIIDTAPFQRLRHIKQLGMCYSVFPGANHSRFEHCLGTGWLAQKTMNNIAQHQGGELGIEERDIRNVTMAGLVHDLGHAAYSHLFDRLLVPALLGSSTASTWSHEKAAGMLLDYLVDENNIDLEREDLRMIKDIVLGDKPPIGSLNEKPWLYDIVCNKANSIDVDKFDYISRDAYHIGIKNIFFDNDRIIDSMRVMGNSISFHCKTDYQLYGLFQTRHKLFKEIYLHKVVMALDYMVNDALLLASRKFNFIEGLNDPQLYSTFTDDMLYKIQTSKKPYLKESQKILDRIDKRDIYKTVGELLVDPSEKPKFKNLQQEMAGYSEYLKPNDLIVSIFDINYGCGNKNPIDNVQFYKSYGDCDTFQIDQNKVSLLLPVKFAETYVRVICRDKNKVKYAKDAFRRCCKKEFGDVSNLRQAELYISPDIKNWVLGKRKEEEKNNIPITSSINNKNTKEKEKKSKFHNKK